MIGQGIGLAWLVPLALDVLERQPPATGDFYPGDLLGSVLRVGHEFWSREAESRSRAWAVLDRIPAIPMELDDAVASFRKNAA